MEKIDMEEGWSGCAKSPPLVISRPPRLYHTQPDIFIPIIYGHHIKCLVVYVARSMRSYSE